MMGVINALKPVHSDMRIHLRSRDIGMSEDRLDRPQIGSLAHHVGGATVAQHVRTRLAVELRLPNNPPDALATEAGSTSIDENKRRAAQSA